MFPQDEKPIKKSICVDGSCRGNPGPIQYRVVNYETGSLIFESKTYSMGTNIIAEFLAIVHGLAWAQKNKLDWPIYSDCVAAIIWVKDRRINTGLEVTAKTAELFGMINRALIWLNDYHYDNEVLKWDTEKWGEIPADFGRK